MIPLLVAAAVFMAFLVLRTWPVFGDGGGRAARAAHRAANERLTRATTDAERVEALVAAGDASAQLVSGGGRAVSYYLRAMKLAPTSAELVNQVARGMAKRPRGLENILWRRLGAEDWQGDRSVLTAILMHLAGLYSGPLKSSVRARAFSNLMSTVAAKGRASTAPPKE
ncbi:MAG: hypothetical protein U0235_11995 [Polyangiaceae bacterium]